MKKLLLLTSLTILLFSCGGNSEDEELCTDISCAEILASSAWQRTFVGTSAVYKFEFTLRLPCSGELLTGYKDYVDYSLGNEPQVGEQYCDDFSVYYPSN